MRVDPELPEHKEHYPDGAGFAFVLTMCFAEQQPRRGRFRNRRILSALLGRRARWIPFLIDRGDLVELDKGELYFDGWDEWQEGDWKVAERMKRIRDRKRQAKADTAEVTPSDTVTDTLPAVSPPSERQAVGGRRLAVSASQVVCYLNPEDDPVIKLGVWWQGFFGRIGEDDKVAAAAYLVDFQRLGLEGIKDRIIKSALWRVENNLRPFGKLGLYRDRLREEETHLADQGVTRPRTDAQAFGLEKAFA